ncbi:hypothetical protein ACWGJB_47635 [Streptomyces sp. NPDC054813]
MLDVDQRRGTLTNAVVPGIGTGTLLSGDGTLRLIVFMGAATCAALTLGGGAWLAGLL